MLYFLKFLEGNLIQQNWFKANYISFVPFLRISTHWKELLG